MPAGAGGGMATGPAYPLSETAGAADDYADGQADPDLADQAPAYEPDTRPMSAVPDGEPEPTDGHRGWRSAFRRVGAHSARRAVAAPPDRQPPTPADLEPAVRQIADQAVREVAGRAVADSAGRPLTTTRRRGRPQARPQSTGQTVYSRPLLNPRLAADPRLKIWVTRSVISVAVFLGFMLWLGWRIGLTIAVVFAVLDTVFRSKTTAVIPPAIRVTTAQRSTMRRLKVLKPAGYLALNTCTVPGERPGTRSIIDHFVVGPAGVFVLDSERLDRRLPVRAVGGKLYHGPDNLEKRLRHSRWEAHQAATALAAELGYPLRVRPAMVIYGPKLSWVVMRLQGVDVFDGGRVGTYFRRQSKATVDHHLDARQINVIFAAAARALPPMQ